MAFITWKDIDINLTKAQNGDITTQVNTNAIQNSLGNIFKTLPGSRRMVPEAFSPIWGVLFEPIDEQTSLRLGHLLLQSIERWEDRITVEGLHVTAKPDDNLYEMKLSYRVAGSDNVEELVDVIRAR